MVMDIFLLFFGVGGVGGGGGGGWKEKNECMHGFFI